MGAGYGRGGTGCPWGREGTRGGDKNPAWHRLNSALFTSHNTPGEGEWGGGHSPSGPGGGTPSPKAPTQHPPPLPEPPSTAPRAHRPPQSPTCPLHREPQQPLSPRGGPQLSTGRIWGGVPAALDPSVPSSGGFPPPWGDGGRGDGEFGEKNKPQKATGGGRKLWPGGAGGVTWHRAGQGPGGARGASLLPPPSSSSPL